MILANNDQDASPSREIPTRDMEDIGTLADFCKQTNRGCPLVKRDYSNPKKIEKSKIHQLMFPLKPPFMGNFPLPCLMKQQDTNHRSSFARPTAQQNRLTSANRYGEPGPDPTNGRARCLGYIWVWTHRLLIQTR